MNAHQHTLPRSGLKGWLDRFVGPGATQAELILQFLFPIIAATGAVVYAWHATNDWSLWHFIVCALLAFDVTGGIITNATSAAKRWYHRPGQNWPQHLGFVAVHVVHLVFVSWLFLDFDISWLVVAALFLMFASCIIVWTRLYLQRPVALILYGVSLLLSLYILESPLGLEWFLPFFYLKLLVSHLPAEKSYFSGESAPTT